MEFPREVTFALESVTYKATLVKKDDIPVAASATSACNICHGALGADAFYKTDPDIFQVHAKCAMEYAEQRAATRSYSNNSDSLRDVPFHNPNTNYYSTHGSYAAYSPQQPQCLQGLVNPMNYNYSQAYLYPQHQQYPPCLYHHSFPPPQQQYPPYLYHYQHPMGHYYPPPPYPQQQYPPYLYHYQHPMGHYYPPPPHPHHPPPQQQQHSQGLWNSLGNAALVAFSSQLFQGMLQGFLS